MQPIDVTQLLSRLRVGDLIMFMETFEFIHGNLLRTFNVNATVVQNPNPAFAPYIIHVPIELSVRNGNAHLYLGQDDIGMSLLNPRFGLIHVPVPKDFRVISSLD